MRSGHRLWGAGICQGNCPFAANTSRSRAVALCFGNGRRCPSKPPARRFGLLVLPQSEFLS